MNVLYVLIIVCANVITAMFSPICIYGLIIPCGSFLVGVTFFLRDFIQLNMGRTHVYKLILLASTLSGVVSFVLGDSLWVSIASVASFFISEAIDTEIFTRLKRSLVKRIFISGAIGGTLDSAIFVIIALSPFGSGMLPWSAVPYAILGQAIVKCCMQLGSVLLLSTNLKDGERSY